MEAKRRAFELEICDTITLEYYYSLSVLNLAIIDLCFSVAGREMFDIIKTRVRDVFSTFSTCLDRKSVV